MEQTKEKTIDVKFPNFFKKADLGDSLDSVRNLIQEQDGNVVLLQDSYYEEGRFLLARIRYDPKDSEYFYAQMLKEDKTLQECSMNYICIEALMVPSDSTAFHRKVYDVE